MLSNIKDCESYELIILQKNNNRKQIEKALDIVKKYIIKNNLILTGGMAIDLALKEKGSKLYSESVLPDYDFYSSDYHNTAYDIGKILCEMGMENVSVINARHSTTMRVRVNYEAVADITYIPENIYKKIPTLKNKDDILIEHPHFKMINIHSALSYLFENPPLETILGRIATDIKRYDLLYEKYPLNKIKFTKPKMIKRKIDITLLNGNCLSGFDALYFWIEYSKKNKFPINKKKEIITIVPSLSSLSLISDNPIKLENDILKMYKKSNNVQVKYFNSVLENIPPKTIISTKNNTIEILDNRGSFISAVSESKFHIVNLQFIMSYFLLNFILSEKKEKDKYIWGYNECYNLIKNASENINNVVKEKSYTAKKILPNIETYGNFNISILDVETEKRNLFNLNEIKKPNFRPINIYPNLKKKCIIPEKVKNFKIRESWIYEINGLERKFPTPSIDSL